MDFFTKMNLRLQGYTGDGIKAYEQAWSEVPEPIRVVVKRDGTVYYEGQQTNLEIYYGDQIATLADGTPVIVLHPQPNGRYEIDGLYNEENIDTYREERYEAAYRQIRAHKWDEWKAQQQAQQPKPVVIAPPRPAARRMTDAEVHEAAMKLIRGTGK
jgi:hypothetical protein